CGSENPVGIKNVALFSSGATPVTESKETWGYVNVRDGAHMFWWLYYANNPTKNFTQLPLVMWLQVQSASVLFVDNPVGTGYSYTSASDAFAKDLATVASDMMGLLKQFFQSKPEFQGVPFYIFSESYGGKMAAAIALSLNEAVQTGSIKCNFAGVALGDSWISPLGASLSLSNTNGVNFYNILTKDPDEGKGNYAAQNGYLGQSAEVFSSMSGDFMKPVIDIVDQLLAAKVNVTVYNGQLDLIVDTMASLYQRHVKPLHRQTLDQLMNGEIRKKLKIIPDSVTWGGQSAEVFSSMSGDFMKPVIDIVDQLLAAKVNVTVYNGQLDLIVDTMGQEVWVKKLKWPGLASFSKMKWTPLYVSADQSDTAAFYKSYENFTFYWILKAGHMKKLREKVVTLRGQIEKTKNVIFEMKGEQSSLRDSAANRKAVLEAEYRVMKDLIEKDEREAMNLVDTEEQSAQARIQSLMHKMTKNIEELSSCKDQIESVLAQGQRITLLQCTVELPKLPTFTHAPGINMNSKQLKMYNSSAVSLKKYLTDVLSLPVEERVQMLNAGLYNTNNLYGQQSLEDLSDLHGLLLRLPPQTAPREPHFESKIDKPFNPTEVKNRQDLLQYAFVLTLDARTAHKRIVISDNFTKASVSDEMMTYPDSPARFTVCSQVLCSKGFSRGRHYWEVTMTSSNFCAIGVASGSIERKGPTSKLGRNKESWCIEWFNVKLSAWHDQRETVLENPSSSRVGVLLDCDGGSLTFYSISDRVYPIHTFSCRFPEAVYPAFWLFSSGTAVSLCKLTA
ncbi:UNVERIFIED_CONTAM: hypothetical protein FKN15_042427, partial [Acipenser sinensis]